MRYFIAGWYGYGNIGDEAILQGMLRLFRVADPQGTFIVASGNPARTRTEHGVASVGLEAKAMRSAFNAICASDCFVLGGGGYWTDWQGGLGGLRPLMPWMSLAGVALACGIPVVALGIGVRSLRSVAAKFTTASLFDRFWRLYVREPESAEILRWAGVHQPIQVCPDMALGLDAVRDSYPPTEVALVLAEPYSLKKERVTRFRNEWRRRSAYLIEKLASELESSITLMPMHITAEQAGDDLEFSKAVIELLSSKSKNRVSFLVPANVNDTLRLFARSKLVVSVRLHGSILAFLQGTPAIGISYDPKVRRWFDFIKKPERCFDLSNVIESEDALDLLLETAKRAVLSPPQNIERLVEFKKKVAAAVDEVVTLCPRRR